MKNKNRVVLLLIFIFILLSIVLLLFNNKITSNNSEKNNDYDEKQINNNIYNVEDHDLYFEVEKRINDLHTYIFSEDYDKVMDIIDNFNHSKENVINYYSNVYNNKQGETTNAIINEMKINENLDFDYIFIKGVFEQSEIVLGHGTEDEHEHSHKGDILLNTIPFYYLLTVNNKMGSYNIKIIDQNQYETKYFDKNNSLFSMENIIKNQENILEIQKIDNREIMEKYYFNLKGILQNEDKQIIDTVITNLQEIENILLVTSTVPKEYSVNLENNEIIVIDNQNIEYKFNIESVLNYTVEITQK